MKNPGRILVATHLGPGADEALREGVRLAVESGGTLGIVHVTSSISSERTTVAHRKALRRIERSVRLQLSQAAGTPGRVEVFVEEGTPHLEIVARAERWGADTVVVGASAHPFLRRIFPGVGERLIREGTCPVLVARATTGYGGVVAATDLTKPRLPAVRAAVQEAARRGLSLKVVHAVSFWQAEARYLLRPRWNTSRSDFQSFTEELERALDANGLVEDCQILQGSAANAIVDDAAATHAKLIVVAATRAKRASKAVALEVVSKAPCSVLVVPAAA